MVNSTRRVPVYRQVQQEPQPNGPDDQHPVIMHLNDGLQPYVPPRTDPGQSAPALAPAILPQQPMRQHPQSQQQEPPPEAEFDLFGKVMFALRGRWLLAIGLAIISGAAGAYVGFHFKPVTYRSEGVLSISYMRPKVLREGDNGGSLTLFDSQLTAQTDVIKSRDVIEKALLTETWQKTGKGNSPRMASEVGLKVIAEHPVQSELIRVKYTDPDPYVAAAAVNSLIAAFTEVYTTQASQLDRDRMKLLEEHRAQLSSRLETLETQINDEIGAVIARNRPTAAAPPPDPQKVDEPVAPVATQLTLREIAKEDVAMAAYLAQQEQMEDSLQKMRDTGAGSNHPDVIRQTLALERLNEKINRHAQDYQAAKAAAAKAAAAAAAANVKPVNGQPPAPAPAPGAPPALAAAPLSPRYDSLKAEAARVRDELTDTLKRLETLRIENSVGSRVNLVAKGEVPVIPYADSQLKLLAVGGLGGAVLPIAVLILWGLVGQKYRFSDDADTEADDGVPLLGILPMLSENREELEKRADAAHCIHQIRAILQMRRPMQSAYLVTSATAGEGKTSLTAALAFAFAASGARTLLIDSDLIGQRLTGGFKCDRLPGLHEAMLGAAIQDCVKRIDHGLRFMPVGKIDTLAAWTLSATGFRKILDEARKHFDVVLVDTGPALGSVEASVVAPEVDGVIFTIARGQQRWLVEKATKHVKAVGGKLIGMVFNRAEARDFNRSAFRSSVRSSTMPQEPDWSPRRELPEANRLGPLVKSVATLLPANGQGRS